MNIESIKALIKEGKTVDFPLYNFSDSEQKVIYESILELFTFYDKENLFLAIHTATFESIMNAIKANAKKAYFQHIQLDVNHESEYKKGTLEFKKLINENKLSTYCELAKKQGLYTRVIMDHSRDGVKIEVINNSALLDFEESRIREKFKMGLKYNSVVDFYIENPDLSEGEGLGLVVSTLMLKQEGIPISDFRIGSKNGVTKARVEVPFTSKYVSERQKYELESLRTGF